ncbi:MAG: glycosyltransferase family 39 protein [Candidatus Helarchaeota archaeon]|nr:glycosyltransferase family 39 protein [Candidatus Helarchaeota archaeon]
MRFLFLDFPDLTTDETFFVSSSYPIIDPFNVMGIPPPPFTYLSSHHPPLNIVGTNLVLNIINPFDWLSMKDWMGKFFPVFIGSISIFAIFSLLNRVYGRNSGYVGAFFYAVNNYAIIISRIAYQEIFLILFLIIIMEFAYREKWNLVGVFLGLSLLTKFTALTIIPSLLIYFCIRNLRLNQKSMKTFFKKFIYATFLALLLFLPILIANITTYYNFGYADTFWSRVFGLRDPMTEAYGEAEMPIGLIPTGVLTYDPLISGQLINVIGPILIPFITLCVILSFLDKPKKLGFIIFIYSFYLIFYLIFTSRWFQVVSLSPIIIPITIISCRIVNLDKLFSKFNIFLNKSYPHIPLKIKSFIRRVEKYTIKFRVPKTFSYKYIKTNYKTHKVKHQHFIICSFLITILSFSFIYSFNTLYKPHYFLDYKFDDVTETLKTNFEYSTLGYLWIMNVGYDEVMEIVRLFRFSNVYVDDTHPVFSYLYYFYTRGFTALVSDWDNRTNSLFIFYKSPNYFWEPFARSNKGDANEDYIKLNGDRIWNSLNFEIYVI